MEALCLDAGLAGEEIQQIFRKVVRALKKWPAFAKEIPGQRRWPADGNLRCQPSPARAVDSPKRRFLT
jgi:hypothetical protein